MADRTVEIDLLLKTTGNAAAGVDKTTAAMKRLSEQANQTRERMEKIAQVGQRIALVGAAITTPLVLSMKKYVDTAKDFEPTSRRIIAATEKWEKVQTRIGRVLAREVVPGLEKAADIMDKIASVSEASPNIPSAALNTGALLTVSGSLIAATSQLSKTLLEMPGGAQAGAELGKASGKIMQASFVIATAYLAFEGGRIIMSGFREGVAQATGVGVGSMSNIAAAGAGKIASSLGPLGGAAKAVSDLVFWYSGVATETEKVAAGAEKASGGLNKLAKSAKATGESLMSDETLAKRAAVVKELETAQTRLTAAQKSAADVARDIAQKEKQRQAERAEIVRNANKEAQRAEEDHRRALADIVKRRNQAVEEATQNRDALALVRAEQTAQDEKDKENEQYQTAARRRREDLQDQLRAFDARAQLERQADQQRLIQAQQAAMQELEMVRRIEAAKIQIFASAMQSISRLAQRGSMSLGVKDFLPVFPNSGGGGSSTTQSVTVNMASGQSIAAMRREIASNNASLAGALSSALGVS